MDSYILVIKISNIFSMEKNKENIKCDLIYFFSIKTYFSSYMRLNGFYINKWGHLVSRLNKIK